MKSLAIVPVLLCGGPAPHGAGGLKFAFGGRYPLSLPWSRPARGGWVEIRMLSPRLCTMHSPAPHGAGGLKFHRVNGIGQVEMSRPARGGWVEIAPP